MRGKVTFRVGDPGKHIHALVPTPSWKAVRDAAEALDITIGEAAQRALAEWGAKHRP